MMLRMGISSSPDGFLRGETEASAVFERLLVLHQCCTDNMYQNDGVIIEIYQSRVEAGLADDAPNRDKMGWLWKSTATPLGDCPADLRVVYSEYSSWLYDVLRVRLYFPDNPPCQEPNPAQQPRGDRLAIQSDPACPPTTTTRPQGTSTTSGGSGGRRTRD